MILTIERYQLITGDHPSPPVFASAAAEAQGQLEDALGRPDRLELGDRVEQCDVAPDGTIYPEATPIITVEGGGLVHNDVVYGARPDVNIFTGYFPGPEPFIVTLHYRGGYDSTSAPACMVADLAWATYLILHPEVGQAAVANIGRASVRQGDTAVGFGGARPDLASRPAWSAQTLRYRSRAA